MALPPEPIDELIPSAEAGVLAEVTRVLTQDPEPPARAGEPGATSAPTQAARQVVELKVTGTLFGEVKSGALLQVTKPAGAYALRAGNQGPFLLGKAGTATQILGRYGPDTWPEAVVREAAKKHQKG